MDNGIEPIPWQNEYQTTFIRIHGHGRVFILFVLRLGHSVLEGEIDSQQAGRPRTHARTTFGFGSAVTAEVQFRDPLRPASRRAGTRARLHNASFF